MERSSSKEYHWQKVFLLDAEYQVFAVWIYTFQGRNFCCLNRVTNSLLRDMKYYGKNLF